MFGSIDAKKRFQKPNILRKKPKCSAKVNSAGLTSFATNNLVNTSSGTKDHSKVTQDPVQTLKTNDELFSNKSLNGTRNEELSIVLDGTNNNQECASQNPVNIELFINDSQLSQNNYQYDIYNDIGSQIKHDWALDFTNGSQEVIIERFDGSELNEDLETNTSVTMVPLSEISSSKHVENNTTENIQNLPGNNFTIEYTMNFKCDVPNCNKRFKSEENLARHKFTHHAQSSSTLLPKPTNFECPVKKKGTDEGTDVPCGMTFFTREELVEHLNESHSPNDASYMCGSCGRTFFWAVGLRSHARARCAAPRRLACGWPGCGRVFRQPCRLREHTRKHTGDKPYPCRFPNCSWSFRTASKLVRHARRHTGERRHVCAACGRGFLRREHLKDHLARHKAHTHACRHPGCQRTFTNLGALLTHMKKMHRDDTGIEPETATLDDTTSTEQTYFVSLEMSPLEGEAPPAAGDPAMAVADAADADADPDPDADEDADAGAESQWHAARTHCTWPLEPRAAAEPYETANQYILEEDVQVELSEGSESNIYTIRSDLFLHGNILNNEDSEHIPGAAAAGPEAEAGADAGLGLLDAHPTIDLMPEELLYTDAAVDESSFRVFLLSGEEIQIV